MNAGIFNSLGSECHVSQSPCTGEQRFCSHNEMQKDGVDRLAVQMWVDLQRLLQD